MMSLQVFDNVFDDDKWKLIYEYCIGASYSIGEADFKGAPLVGMIHELTPESEIYAIMLDKMVSSLTTVGTLQRMYINCFAPNENPFFHIDGETGYTVLYYPQPNWNENDGGTTDFLYKDHIHGSFPIGNRMVVFPQSIPHRATTFRDRHRFTVAVKYE